MKFSFIVIGHNQTDTILAAIDSVLNQSQADVEVIYVDDASTDNTIALVQNTYSDERLKIVALSENSGPLIARIEGIDRATGDWVLFLDGDDTYALHTCQTLSNAISACPTPVDMIGFGVNLIYKKDVSTFAKNDLEQKLRQPYLGALTGDMLMDEIFLKQSMSWNIANKCYSVELLRQVSAEIKRKPIFAAEDFYMNFLACSMVQHYYGIDAQLYQYAIGVGISTSVATTLKGVQNQISGIGSVQLAERYARKKGILDKFQSVFTKLRIDLLYSSYEKMTHLPEQEKTIATKTLFEHFGTRNVLSHLSAFFFNRESEVAKHLDVKNTFPFQKRPVKTIGMVYHRMYNGGVERVIQLLTPILNKAGYKVVVITNDDINEQDYPLPEGTARVVLGTPCYDIDPELGYGPRYDTLTKCIREHQIDAVIYHAWVSEALFWDMCAIKNAGAACIVHCHGAFITGLNTGWMHCVNSASIFHHADAIAALSEVDRYYWSTYNPNVFTVNNPLTFRPSDIPQSKQDNHNVIWTGRFDPTQKNPYDILHVFSRVVNSVPDAKLYLVGSGTDDVVENMYRLTNELGLTEHVVFTGFTSNVGQYLQNAAVYLFTSDFEGYSMAFAEALSYGLPVVTYPLPYMTMAKDSKATVQVGWKDIQGAADALIDLLSNDEKRRTLGQIAREEAISYENEDYAITWNRILDSLEQDISNTALIPERHVLDAYQKTVKLGFDQMAHRIHTTSNQVVVQRDLTFDYTSMSKPKRWLAYLLYDRGTLKSIVKYKNRNHPSRLKMYSTLWKIIKRMKGPAH